MSKWLAVVGIGEEGLAGLGPAAKMLVGGARTLVGGARHLAMIPEDGRERLTWTRPLSLLVGEIERRRGTPVCVLATGDPMHYGIGVTLAKRIALEEMTIVPAPSAFSLACARLGWPRAAVATLTLHGRPLALLNAFLQPGRRLLVLSENAATPLAVAAHLRAHGYGRSRLSVLEHMGGERERILSGTAEGWRRNELAELNTLAIECVADEAALLLAPVPGLPDEAFHHDGQLTKREVRAITLAALAPVPGQLLWDVGAGCGSVAIEWLRCHSTCRAIAIEAEAARLRLIADNATALGVPALEIVGSCAPESLDGLASPDAVFIGGGGREAGLFERCWEALKPGGRLVANAVTLAGETRLIEWRARVGGSLTRIAIERAECLGFRSGAARIFFPSFAARRDRDHRDGLAFFGRLPVCFPVSRGTGRRAKAGRNWAPTSWGWPSVSVGRLASDQFWRPFSLLPPRRRQSAKGFCFSPPIRAGLACRFCWWHWPLNPLSGVSSGSGPISSRSSASLAFCLWQRE